jgi:hypothetical protein
MTKLCLAGALALAMTSGQALAQTTSTEKSTSTTMGPGSYSAEKSEKRNDAFGNSAERKESTESDATGTTSKQQQKVHRSDGSSETQTNERSTKR